MRHRPNKNPAGSLSVLIAGPVISRLGEKKAEVYLRGLRLAFPSSQLVVSTWPGEVAGLTTTGFHVVENSDPGPDDTPPNWPLTRNYSRMVISVAAGLEVVERPLAIRARCEVAFSPGSEQRVLDLLSRQRNKALLVSNWWSHRCIGYPELHISDILHMGHTERLREVWMAAYNFRERAIQERSPLNPAANEQLLWSSYLFSQGLLSNIMTARETSSLEIRGAWVTLLRRDVLIFKPERLDMTSIWSELNLRCPPNGYLQGARYPIDKFVDKVAIITRPVRHGLKKA